MPRRNNSQRDKLQYRDGARLEPGLVIPRRATGSRERAPDGRFSQAIHGCREDWMASSQELLALTSRDAARHSAALAAFAPNIRVGAAKPQDVPSVTLTWSSQGRRKVPATMSCMKV